MSLWERDRHSPNTPRVAECIRRGVKDTLPLRELHQLSLSCLVVCVHKATRHSPPSRRSQNMFVALVMYNEQSSHSDYTLLNGSELPSRLSREVTGTPLLQKGRRVYSPQWPCPTDILPLRKQSVSRPSFVNGVRRSFSYRASCSLVTCFGFDDFRIQLHYYSEHHEIGDKNEKTASVFGVHMSLS